MKKLLLTTLFLFSFAFSAFAQTGTSITEEQAIEIAKQAAIANGKSSEWFGGEVKAKFDGTKWIIDFSGKPDQATGLPLNGDNCCVAVSSDGTETKIVSGP